MRVHGIMHSGKCLLVTRAALAIAIAWLVATPAAAITLDCTFGDSIGVGVRDSVFKQGSKAGSQRITFQTLENAVSPDPGVRKAADDPDRPARVLHTEFQWQFVVTWALKPAEIIEVTTIAKHGAKRVGGMTDRAAVRTVQFVDTIGTPTASIDYGYCEVRP